MVCVDMKYLLQCGCCALCVCSGRLCGGFDYFIGFVG